MYSTAEINNDSIAKNKLSQITPNNPTSHLEYLFYEDLIKLWEGRQKIL